MPRNDSGRGRAKTKRDDRLPIDRRSYLKLAGAAVGSAGLFSGTASAAERHGIRFTNTVNMVTEAGCDPTGQEPCDAKIRAAADDYTLLKFPAGEYKLTEKNVVLDKTNIGFLGVGDVRFTVPEGFNEKLFVVERGTGLLFEGIDVDQTAYGATPGLHLAADDDLQIHDVEFIGQGRNPDNEPQDCGNEQIEGCSGNEPVTDALYPIVRSPDGVGVVRNVVAPNAGYMGTYSRIGVWVGASTEGTIRLENCQFEEFSGNGLYGSRTYGVVQVEGGQFRNNDVSQVRIGSEGSYVANAVIGVDANDTRSPNPEDALNQRGVWLESRKYGGNDPTVRNCDIAIVDTPNSSGGVVTASTVGDFSVTDTRIGIDVDGVQGILGYSSDEAHTATVRGVSVTGSASGGEAIKLIEYSNSRIAGCCIHHEGADRDGVVFVDSDGCVVRNSTVDVTGEAVSSENSAVTVSGVSERGSCPAPASAPSSGEAPSDTLTIEGAPGTDYELAVSGALEKSSAMSGTTIDPNDELSGANVTGQVGEGGRDSYAFSGEITRLVLDGGTNLYYNGERADPANYLPNTVTVESASDATYEITTTDGIVKSAAMGAADPNDDISGRTASGYVGAGGRDSYAYPGEINSLDIDGDATVYHNGEKVDPDDLGTGDTLTIEGAPGAGYELAVSDTLEKSLAMSGTTIDPNDGLSGASATGQVGNGGRDSYTFSGEITRLLLNGGANLYYNGERADPANYLPNTVTVESQSHAEYEITTTDGIVKSAAMGAADPNDIVAGTTATGQVGEGGRDSYAYTGEIESLTIDGDATVYRNGAVLSNPERV